MDLRNMAFSIGFKGDDSGIKAMDNAADKMKANVASSYKEMESAADNSAKSQRSQAASLAAAYRKAGMDQSEAMKKAWSEIDRTSSTGSAKAKKSINDINGASFDSLIGKAKAAGAAIVATFAIDKIIEFGAAALESAGSAKAISSQFTQTFGDLEPAAQKAVDSMSGQFGMVPNRLKPSMSQMTSMFKGLGLDTESSMAKATDAVTASADAAAFYDKSYADANSALTSFIKGNYEGGESIGLFANDTQMAQYAIQKGLVTSTGAWSELDEATKQATRLEYAQNMQKLAGATGQASREADGWENQVGNVKQAWSDFLAVIGKPALGMAVGVMKNLTDGLKTAGEKVAFLTDGFQGIGDPAALSGLDSIIYMVGDGFRTACDGFNAAYDGIKKKVEENTPNIQASFASLKTSWDLFFNTVNRNNEEFKPGQLGEWAGNLLNLWIQVESAGAGVVLSVGSWVQNIANFWTSLGTGNWGGVADSVKGVGSSIVGVVENLTAFFVGAENAKNAWSSVGSFFGQVGTNIQTGLSSAGNSIGVIFTGAYDGVTNTWNGAVSFFSGLSSDIGNSFNGVSESINGAFEGSVSYISGLPGKFTEWGADMVQGLVDGIMGAKDAVGSAVQSVADKITAFLHFSRPDEGPLHYYEEWMPDMMRGLAGGITSNAYLVNNALSRLSSDMSIGINGGAPNVSGFDNQAPSTSKNVKISNRSGSGSGSSSITIKNEFNINVGAGSGGKEIVSSIEKEWLVCMERFLKKYDLRNPQVTA